MDRILII